MRRFAYGWITLAFFLVSIGLHWLFGWHAFVEEASSHGEQPRTSKGITDLLLLCFVRLKHRLSL